MKTLQSQASGETEFSQPGALTDRTLAAVRLILAAGGSIMIYVATEPERYVSATYYSLLAYTSYSLVLYLLARRRINFSPKGVLIILWADVACFTVLTSLNSGTNNLFSFFYLFAIIVASSRCGTRMGLWVTAASAILFIAVGLSVTTRTPLEMNRFLLRRSAMVAIGYILAYWGGAELGLKRRMALLNELSLVANPRFGVQRTIEQMLQRLRAFYEADYCILLMKADDGLELYRTARGKSGGTCQPVRLGNQDQIPQIDIGGSYSGIYTSRKRPWSKHETFRGYRGDGSELVDLSREEGRAIADFLGAESFVTVPLQYHEQLRGRLLVSSRRRNAFDIADAAFLRHVAGQVLPVIENIRLVDRMASDASEEERRRIARSVHDRVIQPYFGLQIGLKALHDMLGSKQSSVEGSRALGHERETPIALIDQLMVMTSEGIDELRRYIRELKHSAPPETRLVDSIRRFASKFEGATGIQVDVVNDCQELATNERLNAEVFQMTAEALSNVHRHTNARNARVSLDFAHNNLILSVENEVAAGTDPVSFNPLSICERAEALGGRTEVRWPDNHRTVVRVEVPL